jgi:hypothetical protein
MSLAFWDTMPVGFLKMGYKSWRRLDSGVKHVVAELAESQKFRCALCSETRDLVIDHDHEPEEGPGHPYTAFNIRGLVCQGCNWHLIVYEKQESGDYFGWENADSRISNDKYESYDYVYRCRVRPLIEAKLEQRMGSANYWRRALTLQRFDAWYYDGEWSEWRDRWAKRQAWKIKTPEQFIERMQMIVKFYSEQIDKNPDFVLPDEFIKLVAKVRGLIQEALAIRRASADIAH